MEPHPFPQGPLQHAPHGVAGMRPHMPHPPGRPPAGLPGPPAQHTFPRPSIPWGNPPPGAPAYMFQAQQAAASWTTHTSPTGAPYYYNHVTRESTWVRPACIPDMQPQPSHASAAESAVVSADQARRVCTWLGSAQGSEAGLVVPCADGRVYFSNASSNTTVWTCPPEVAHLVPPTSRFVHQPGMPVPVRPVPASSARPMPRPAAPPPLAQPPPVLQPPTAAGLQPPASPQFSPQQMAQNSPALHPGRGQSGGWPGWRMPTMSPWQPGGNPAAAAAADAKAESAKAAAEASKNQFFQMLVEHKINAFSRWEACKKFDSDPRFLAVAAKERKALFNSFCANVVEETRKMEEQAQATSKQRLQELFTELLGVTPMQLRLFQAGTELAEVEAAVARETEARAARLRQFVGEDPEDGEQGDDGEERRTGSEDSEDVLAVAALHADLDMVCGGVFTAGMKTEDLTALIPGEERWAGADADLREQVFIEVLGPVLEERAAQDAALVRRFERRMHGWLSTQEISGASAEEAWGALAGSRPPLLALLPDRLCLQMVRDYMEASRKSQKQRDREASATMASARVKRRKREAEQLAEQRQQEAAKLTDEEAFRTLLFETVKDPSKATWKAVQEKLRKDRGQRMSSALISQGEYEGLFHTHVAALLTTARKQYTAALEEHVRPALVTPDGSLLPAEKRGAVAVDWRSAEEVLSTCACFQKLDSQERYARWQAFVGGGEDSRTSLKRSNNQQGRDRDQLKPAEPKRSRR